MARTPKPLTEKKISVRHVLNKQLKPNEFEGKLFYPVYVEARLDDKKTFFPSNVNYLLRFRDSFSQDPGQLIFIANEESIKDHKDLIKLEEKIIFEIIKFYRDQNINLIALGSASRHISYLMNTVYTVFSEYAKEELFKHLEDYEISIALDSYGVTFNSLYVGLKEICSNQFFNDVLKDPFEFYYYISLKLSSLINSEQVFLYQILTNQSITLKLIKRIVESTSTLDPLKVAEALFQSVYLHEFFSDDVNYPERTDLKDKFESEIIPELQNKIKMDLNIK